MSMKKIIGISLATAAAGMVAIAPISMAADPTATDNVNCYGVNACKGQAADGKNACKGQAAMSMSAADCTAKGGSTTAPAAPATPATSAAPEGSTTDATTAH